MSPKLEKLTALLRNNAPAPPLAIAALRQALGAKVPADYLEYLQTSNGSSYGAIGGSTLVIDLLPAEKIVESSRGYDFPEGLWHIGGDGIGTAIQLDLRGRRPVFAAGSYMSDDRTNLGATFTAALNKLARKFPGPKPGRRPKLPPLHPDQPPPCEIARIDLVMPSSEFNICPQWSLDEKRLFCYFAGNLLACR